jgi:hypothetical protein
MKPSIYVVGYQPKPGIPISDYLDFCVGSQFGWLEVESMTKQGVFPPGIILQAKGGCPCVIVGPYGHQQEAVKLEPNIQEKN